MFTGLYFILNTFFVYSVCSYFSCTNLVHDIFFLLRDLIWIVWTTYLTIKHFRLFKKFVLENIYIYVVFLLIIVGNFFVSKLNGISSMGMVVWFKYAYFHLYIFLTGSILGYIFSSAAVDKIFKKFFVLFSAFLIIWLCVDLFKLLIPHFFIDFLWFWPIWDYFLWKNPPVYYRTGPWGIMRFAWLWAWPNNYWFLLIGLTPLFVSNSSCTIWERYFILLIGFLTLSRALIVAWISQLIIHILIIRNKISRTLFYLFSVIIWFWMIWVWFLSIYKSTSTALHMSRRYEAILTAIKHPFGIWLWQSWPAVHRGWKLLPENFYLQISIEWWIAMLLLYCFFWYLIYRKSNFDWLQWYLYWLWIWFVGMSIAWMFLHVFEDSMTNYWFFVLFWLAWWNQLQKKWF